MNTAQGKGGSGGRLDALHDLNRNRVSLAGVQLDGAWLEGVALPGADLRRASLRHASLRGADLTGLITATATLRGADLTDLRGWESLANVSYLDLAGVRHAPPGLVDWAMGRGRSGAAAEPSRLTGAPAVTTVIT